MSWRSSTVNRMYDSGNSRDFGRNRAKQTSCCGVRMYCVERMLLKTADKGPEGH